jgi:hypothetical protein
MQTEPLEHILSSQQGITEEGLILHRPPSQVNPVLQSVDTVHLESNLPLEAVHLPLIQPPEVLVQSEDELHVPPTGTLHTPESLISPLIQGGVPPIPPPPEDITQIPPVQVPPVIQSVEVLQVPPIGTLQMAVPELLSTTNPL